jgi:ubiquitin carboxyl-terminal hydrolase L3
LKKDEDKELGGDANIVPFYMNQTGTLDNACGIIACLHAAFNVETVTFNDNSILSRFKDLTANQSPEDRATTLMEFDDFK